VIIRKRSLARRLLTVDLPVVAILLFALGPYAWMFLTSVTEKGRLFTQGPSLTGATLENYVRLFKTVGFWNNLVDSFIIAGGTVVVGLTLSVTAAYAFSRFNFPAKRGLLLQFLVINMFPVVLLILPLFIFMRQLG